MDERQPFDTPGVTRTGNGDSLPLLPEARRQLFLSKLLASTAGVPIWRSRRADPATGASISTNGAGPVERGSIHLDTEAPAPPPPAPGSPFSPLGPWSPCGP